MELFCIIKEAGISSVILPPVSCLFSDSVGEKKWMEVKKLKSENSCSLKNNKGNLLSAYFVRDRGDTAAVYIIPFNCHEDSLGCTVYYQLLAENETERGLKYRIC